MAVESASALFDACAKTVLGQNLRQHACGRFIEAGSACDTKHRRFSAPIASKVVFHDRRQIVRHRIADRIDRRRRLGVLRQLLLAGLIFMLIELLDEFNDRISHPLNMRCVERLTIEIDLGEFQAL